MVCKSPNMVFDTEEVFWGPLSWIMKREYLAKSLLIYAQPLDLEDFKHTVKTSIELTNYLRLFFWNRIS